MADLLLFLLMGIFAREFYFIIPIFILFTYIYFKKNRISNKRALILLMVMILAFTNSFLRFNSFNKNKIVDTDGTVTDVRTFDDYNRITIRSGLSKVYAYDVSKELNRGDKVKYQGRLEMHSRRTMPFLFDARNYFYSNGISYKLSDADLNFAGKSWLSKFENIRDWAAGVYDKYLYENASTISRGLTLRYREDTPILQNIMAIGLSHILSVSGLHLGLIFSFIFFIFSLTGMKIKARSYLSALVIFLYCLVVGFTPSLIRATIMIYVLIYKRLYRPSLETKDALLIAALASLFINPYYIYSIGFLLSYACMFGIVFIYSRFARNVKYEKTLAYYFKTALLLNISIQIATLPIVIYYFNKVNILTIFINILLVPIFSFYLILSVCLLLFSKIKFLAFGLAFAINNMSKFLDTITEFFNKSYLIAIFESPDKIIIVIYYLILLGIIFYNKLRLVKLDYKTLFIMILILLIPNPMNFKNQDRVEFLDVGQGDAALISIGKKNIMIDSGGNPRNQGAVGKNIIEPYLIKTGRRKIDYAFISHYDYDHAGGFTELSDDIKIKHVIVNHKYEAYDDQGDFKDKLEKLKPREVREDASFNLGKDYSINFIGGNQDLINENDRSIVAVFRKKNKNLVLFTGDIEEEAEQKISARFPKTYIIKAPHHGSKTSSSDEILNAVSPKNVVISLGKKNKFGHPHKEVIDRYKKRGINIYRTDLDGLITFDLNDFKIYTYNGKNSIMTIIIIYLQVLVSMILVLYREERWTIQYL